MSHALLDVLARVGEANRDDMRADDASGCSVGEERGGVDVSVAPSSTASVNSMGR
jgi:hypothetical protein